MKKVVMFWVVSLLLGCVAEEHASYDVLKNPLPEGGPSLVYDVSHGLTNVDALMSVLSNEHAAILNASLGWYGTESRFGLDQLHGRTARDLVRTINCLKTEESELCFRD